MKYIKTFETFINENNQTLISLDGVFKDFYDGIKILLKYGNLDEEAIKHLKEAIPHLDQAWSDESEARGIKHSRYKIKF